MIPSKTFEMYWNNTKRIINKKVMTGYFFKAQLFYGFITSGDDYKEQSFQKILHSSVKTIDFYSKPELSDRNQWTVSSVLLPLYFYCAKIYSQADLYAPRLRHTGKFMLLVIRWEKHNHRIIECQIGSI